MVMACDLLGARIPNHHLPPLDCRLPSGGSAPDNHPGCPEAALLFFSFFFARVSAGNSRQSPMTRPSPSMRSDQ